MEDISLANKELNEWCGTKDINFYEGIEALGNLFKYVVPKLEGFAIILTIPGVPNSRKYKAGADIGKGGRVVAGGNWVPNYNVKVAMSGDPALAIFWAVYPAIKEQKNG